MVNPLGFTFFYLKMKDSMTLYEVTDNRTRKAFLEVVDLIYKDDQAYVRPLDVSVEEVFDKNKNSFFSHGEATRFILQKENVVIGRVAAFINNKKAKGYEQPTGGVGFFECIDDQKAAYLLFDVAVKWLSERGMEAMDGPINFGENDNFWGLLVDGFSQPGFGMQYNPPYYREFFEGYGFEKYYEQVTNHLDLKKPFPERFWKIAGWVVQKEGFHFRHFSWRKADKFINDFETVYNDAWKFHENFTPIDKRDLKNTMKKAKSFMIPELIWYAYHNDEPIGFIVMFPDINQIIKHFNGKLTLWHKLQFLWMKHRKTMTRTRVVILGVRPKYQRSGIESGLFWQLKGVMEKFQHIQEMELSWVGDFNPKMRALQESLGATFGKRHITFRYLFDEEKRGAVKAATIPLDTKYQD